MGWWWGVYFCHINPPPPPHPYHLIHMYDTLTFKFKCQWWGDGGGGYISVTYIPHHHPTPNI